MDSHSAVRIADSTILHGWILALRDLCDQGATETAATLPGGLTVHYRPGECRVFGPDGLAVTLSDDDLDTVGFVPVEELASV